ncbi:hypothetical protein BE221DRAFT_205830 [Ostreococcus tauri]|uniref:Plastid lipid-associated protein/fibrillin conserved domain-containing protein n=1 Tax=Ostreococcus tauri TaxID=70448 RepID=A0A1Y5I9S4_OSTTA|nr:hypothetical protein BE221DRAFT_205830 [Ostreococcus tauri]
MAASRAATTATGAATRGARCASNAPDSSRCRRQSLVSSRRACERRRRSSTAAVDDGVDVASSSATEADVGDARRRAKARLVDACVGTYRGALTTADDRSAIAEAQGALERIGDGSETIDFDALDGKWRLAYTNASDVLGLLIASRTTGVPEVGDIFQSFSCKNGKNEGITNEIRLSLPFILSEAKRGEPGGVGLRVQASYEDIGRRRLRLTFQEAKVSEINISPLAETLLAPAILPRGSLNHQVLMFIKELELKFPLRGALTSIGGGEPSGGAAVGSYHLTYVDEDVLVGRAQAGGVYIFTRAEL